MLGYRLYLRETSTITNMIRLSLLENRNGNSALATGVNVHTFLNVPTLPQQLARLGVKTHIFLGKRIAESGLSRLLYDEHSQVHPTVNLSDMLVGARRILNQATGKVFLSLYWEKTDAIAHVHGPWSEEFIAELRAVDAALQRELAGHVEDSLLLVSADHGFMEIRPSDYLLVTDYPELTRGLLLPPVGDARCTYLYVRNGNKEAVARFIENRFGDEFLVLDSQRALRAGLFGVGEIKAEVPERIGDLVVLSTGRKSLYYPYKDSAKLRGMHAGITPQEMLVPLIISPL